MKVPVLLLVFNREDTTRLVLDAIRSAQPAHLFVAADGPREGVEDDARACEAARTAATAVDWPCEVTTLFRDENQGCGPAVSGAVSWFMGIAGEGIVLEDDNVPDATFFPFCQELLDHYRDTPRVMQINGSNFLGGKKRGKASYYFSRYPHIIGWATWARAWRHFDHSAIPAEYGSHIWSWQWRLSVERQRGLAVAPNANLVTNIGCGRPDSVHTKDLDPHYAALPLESMWFPLRHPARIRRMDRYTDYSHLIQEERTYWGAPWRFTKLGYACGRNRLAPALKRKLLG